MHKMRIILQQEGFEEPLTVKQEHDKCRKEADEHFAFILHSMEEDSNLLKTQAKQITEQQIFELQAEVHTQRQITQAVQGERQRDREQFDHQIAKLHAELDKAKEKHEWFEEHLEAVKAKGKEEAH